MKKLESLKNTTFKENTITENKLRNICGGYIQTSSTNGSVLDLVVDGTTSFNTTLWVCNDAPNAK